MAKIITADTRAQEFTYDYFNRRETQLSKYVSDRIDAESETGLSKLTFGYHKMFGRSTAFVETAALAGLGGLIGGPIGAVIGAGIGIASGSSYYQGVGERMGYSGARATAAGAAGDIAANLGIYGVARYGYGLAGGGLAGLGAVGIGAGAGYAADWVTANYLSDWSSGKQMGASGGMGLGIGAGAAALLGFGPVGWAAAGLVGLGTGAYLAYNRLFGGDGDVVGEREQLRNQMQISQGLSNLRTANPNAYNRLLSMADESKLNLQFTNYNAAADSMTADVKDKLLDYSGEITRAYFSDKTLGEGPLTRDLATYIFGEEYTKWSESPSARTRYYESASGNHATKIITDTSISNFIAQNIEQEIEIGGESEAKLARLRYAISIMGGKPGAELQANIIKALGKRTFKGKQGTVYDAKGFFTGHEGSYFQRSREFLKDQLDDVNKQIQALTGAGENFSPVNAANASAIFNILDAKKRGDGEAYNKALAFAQGTMSAGDITTLHHLLGSENMIGAPSDAIDNIQKDIAMAAIMADSAAYQDAIERFGRNKGAMLGTENLSVVQNRMRNLLLGKGGDKSEAYLKLKANNFSAITDEATKVFLQQSEGAMNVLDNIAGKTWAEYKESVQKSDIDSTTKQMLLNQLSGRDEGQFILSDDVTGIRKTVGQQLLASHANYMAQSTGQSLAERQATSLDSIDRGIRELIRLTASDKENDYVKGRKDDKNEFYVAPEDPNSVETTSNMGAFLNAVGKLGRGEFSLF
jgi:hypothetical protein